MNNLPVTLGHSRGRGRGIKRNEKEIRGRVHQLGQVAIVPPLVPQKETPTVAESDGSKEQHKSEEVESATRGAVRGIRSINEVVRSRPAELFSKSGVTGRKVTVKTNYYKLLKVSQWTIYQYRVDFIPNLDNTRLRRGLLNEHRDIFGGYLFDGTLLFCCTQFEQIPNSPYVLELTTKTRADEIIMIKIRSTGIVEPIDNQQLQVLNLILRRAMEGLNLQLVSRNYYDPEAKIILDTFHLELWPGYATSIRQHESEILLCTELAHKVMRTDTLYSTLTKATRECDDYQSCYKQLTVGAVVITDYNNKTYRVDDVDFKANPLSKFTTKDGDITFVEYYKKRYNVIIRDYKQPLLLSSPTEKDIRGGGTNKIMLIPELCRATGLTNEMRSNFRLMKAMSEHTRMAPARRIDRLRSFNQRLKNSEQSLEVLKSWNIELDSNLVEVPARVLPPQKILFGDQGRYLCDVRADWTQECRRRPMFKHVDIKRWYVITPSNSIREVQEFVKLCIKAAKGMRMHIAEPRYSDILDDRNMDYWQSIDYCVAKDPQILMLVMRSPSEEKYSSIKKRTCVDRPVPSQVVTLKTIAPRPEKINGLMSIATKVVIQMTAKLMGAPWMIELPLHGLMTVGFDVCHSTKNKNTSFGALVATMDLKQSTRYYSSVSEHLKGQELSNQLILNMTCALKAYREHHGTLPDRILFFRDGVGDGQLSQVVNTEVKYLKIQLDEIYKAAGIKHGCKMAFLVVSKRINTRYFANNRNPEPGTVVDDIITLPERYDFFLVSQSVHQGTVSPTSYNVIQDNIGLNADKLQMLAYKMTHMYYNWSGSCRVPAVCQYAHKLAFLIAESVHLAPSAGLENQLHFL